MKTIPATELQSDVNAVRDSAQRERIVMAREGKPCAVLLGIEAYDAEDWQRATAAEFGSLLQERRAHGPSLPLSDVEKRFGIRPAKPSRRNRPATVRKTARGKKRSSRAPGVHATSPLTLTLANTGGVDERRGGGG
jgi:PHD/YefM family antitoxin component YafN of YafNO toxin-antitoxin module